MIEQKKGLGNLWGFQATSSQATWGNLWGFQATWARRILETPAGRGSVFSQGRGWTIPSWFKLEMPMPTKFCPAGSGSSRFSWDKLFLQTHGVRRDLKAQPTPNPSMATFHDLRLLQNPSTPALSTSRDVNTLLDNFRKWECSWNVSPPFLSHSRGQTVGFSWCQRPGGGS